MRKNLLLFTNEALHYISSIVQNFSEREKDTMILFTKISHGNNPTEIAKRFLN